MREAARLTGATLSRVVSVLPDISPEEKAALLQSVEPEDPSSAASEAKPAGVLP
jgi:hypothetical protein